MQTTTKTDWWREPLLHFLLIGGLLFGLYGWLESRSEQRDSQRVVVDEAALVSFLQFRAKQFDPPRFAAELAAMGEPQRQALIDEYIREEVLYREAVKLGMDREDYIIRRRMVQKLEFITRGLSEFGEPPSAEQLEAFYLQNQADYRQPADLTLTHLFYDAQRHSDARAAAQAELAAMGAQPLSFGEALGRGDHFPFHKNYVEKGRQVIANHFGSATAAALFDGLAAGELPVGKWFGPLQSAYGWHLFIAASYQPSALPSFADLQEKVAIDYRRSEEDRLQRAAIEAIIGQYQVEQRYAPQ